MTRSCCFCDAPILHQFDFCKPCKETYDAALGPGWTESAWFQATVKESRHLNRLEVADRAHGTVSVEAATALQLADARPVEPEPDLADALRAVIETALQVAPDTGWRRMHRLIQARGITATAKQVRYRLEQIRAAQRADVGQSTDVEVGGS
jgi:hypothetical protein